MPALSGFLWLISYWLIGEVVIHVTALPISSGVIGMLLLCVTLAIRGRVPGWAVECHSYCLGVGYVTQRDNHAVAAQATNRAAACPLIHRCSLY